MGTMTRFLAPFWPHYFGVAALVSLLLTALHLWAASRDEGVKETWAAIGGPRFVLRFFVWLFLLCAVWAVLERILGKAGTYLSIIVWAGTYFACISVYVVERLQPRFEWYDLPPDEGAGNPDRNEREDESL